MPDACLGGYPLDGQNQKQLEVAQFPKQGKAAPPNIL